MKFSKTNLKKRIFSSLGLCRKRLLPFKIAGILAIFLVAGIFLFGGKAQDLVSGKLIAKGNFYFNGGAYDLDKAAKYYKVASFVDGKASYPHYQLARVFFLKTDYKKGLAEIDRALSLNPENKRAFYIRGLINGYSGNYKVAEEDFRKFIEWAPKEWAGYNDLAWVFYEDKEFDKAESTLQKGLKVDPGNPWLLNGLGVVYQSQGESDKAEQILAEAQGEADNLKITDWQRAYPGNNPESFSWDLAKFKSDIQFNTKLTYQKTGQDGIFQPACFSTTVNTCSGSSCVTDWSCDPDHQTCSSSCSSDIDCCPYPLVCTSNSFQNCGYFGCSSGWICSGSWDNVGQGACCSYRCPSCGDGSCDANAGESCSSCPQDCGSCAVNGAPTVAISNPPNGATNQSQSAINFEASASDPDNDPLTYNSTISCGGSTLDTRSGNVSGGAISFTFGPFSSGASCKWTVAVNDGKGGQASATSNFSISSCAPSAGVCGTANGGAFCQARTPTHDDLCSPESTPNPSSIDINAYQVNWQCQGKCGGSNADCSAKGTKACGWIETNP